MTHGFHADLTGTNIHVPFAWSYADSTAREAATGFDSGDVGKLALQEDDNSLWILADDSPETWVLVGGGVGPIDHAHAGVAGDGNTFDAANLTSGTAPDGYVLSADGAGASAWEDAVSWVLNKIVCADGAVVTSGGNVVWQN